MAQPGNKQVHKSRRHNNPNAYKSGKPRLRPLNTKQLSDLLEKAQGKKNQAKIERELKRKQTRALDVMAKNAQELNLQ
jgi:hypothetical protein